MQTHQNVTGFMKGSHLRNNNNFKKNEQANVRFLLFYPNEQSLVQAQLPKHHINGDLVV